MPTVKLYILETTVHTIVVNISQQRYKHMIETTFGGDGTFDPAQLDIILNHKTLQNVTYELCDTEIIKEIKNGCK